MQAQQPARSAQVRPHQRPASHLQSVHCPSAVIHIDAMQRIVSLGVDAEQIFGQHGRQMADVPAELLVQESSRSMFRDWLGSFLKSQENRSAPGPRGTVQCRRWNGSVFPAEVSGAKIAGSHGVVVILIVKDISRSARDLLDRNFVSEAGRLLVSTLEFGEVVENLAQLCLELPADLCVVDVEIANRRLCRMTRARDIDGGLASAIEQSADRRSRPPAVRHALETGRTFLDADGTATNLLPVGNAAAPFSGDVRSAMIVPLQVSRRTLGALTLVSTREELRYAGEDVRLAEELGRWAGVALSNAGVLAAARRDVKSRDEVLRMVAHDLASPVNALTLASHHFLRRADVPAGGPPAAFAQRVERVSRRIARMVNDLMDVGRMAAGKFSVLAVLRTPASLLTDAAEALRPLVGEHELHVEAQDGLPSVLVDEDRVLQVFTNLVTNSVRFTPPGGQISLRASRDPGGVRFEVSDTGIGIASKDLGFVFDRFWQADGHRQGGLGLGLAICQGIVQALGGTIQVTSELGRGTRVSFVLPPAVPAPA